MLFLGCLVFAAGIHFQWVKNSKGKQFSTCSVGLNCDQWKRESNIVSIQWRLTLEDTCQ